MGKVSTFTEALRTALSETESLPAGYAPAVRLAREYATQLDAGGDLAKLGPQLLAVLTALGMTPAARGAVAKGGQREPAASPLDELRQRRAARQHGAAAVDPAAS